MTLISRDISAKQVRTIVDALIEEATATTTNDLADLLVIDAANAQTVAIVVRNTGATHSLDYSVAGSIDGEVYDELADDTIAAEGRDSFVAKPAEWRFYKVQVKSASDGDHTTAAAHAIAK